MNFDQEFKSEEFMFFLVVVEGGQILTKKEINNRYLLICLCSCCIYNFKFIAQVVLKQTKGVTDR